MYFLNYFWTLLSIQTHREWLLTNSTPYVTKQQVISAFADFSESSEDSVFYRINPSAGLLVSVLYLISFLAAICFYVCISRGCDSYTSGFPIVMFSFSHV